MFFPDNIQTASSSSYLGQMCPLLIKAKIMQRSVRINQELLVNNFLTSQDKSHMDNYPEPAINLEVYWGYLTFTLRY